MSSKEVPSAPEHKDEGEEKEEIEEDSTTVGPPPPTIATATEENGDDDDNEPMPSPSDPPTMEDIEREFPNPEPASPPTLEEIERELSPRPTETDEESPSAAETPPEAETATAADDLTAALEQEEEKSQRAAAAAAIGADEEGPCGMKKRTVGVFMMLLVIIIVLQAVMIGLLVNRNKTSDDPDVSNVDRDNTDLMEDPTDTPSMTDAPVEVPPPPTSPEPTPIPTTLAPTPVQMEFISISENPNAERLSQSSACDNCVDSMLLPPNLAVGDDDAEVVTAVTVSSNGFVSLECEGLGGTCATIDVISMDLNPGISGDVHFMGVMSMDENVADTKQQPPGDLLFDQYIISWENVRVNLQPESYVNAQAILHAGTGMVDLCWGMGDVKGATFRAGIWNNQDFEYLPAKGPSFDVNGFSNEFPSNTCQRFRLNDNDGMASLSPSPSLIPPPTGTFPPGILYPGTFTYLANEPFVRRLEAISACDDCEEMVTVDYQTGFLPGVTEFDLQVSSNGYLTVNCPFGGCAFIEVVAADLNPERGGNVYMYDYRFALDSTNLEPLYIISWENITFHVEPSNSLVNGQVKFYEGGRMEMCWGEGSTGALTFSAGLSDFSNALQLPVEGGPFENGVVTNGEWPTNLCYSFDIGGPGVDPPSPSPVPSSPGEDFTCIPTRGACVTDYASLVAALDLSRDRDTIAICGSIFVPGPVGIFTRDITLCCSDSYRCTLTGGGSDQILIVAGQSATLRGLTFDGGVDSVGEGGGNVAFFAPGHHRVIQCQFLNGSSDAFGGNLIVWNADSFSIENSIFESGSATSAGGGVMFQGTAIIRVSGSYFSNNSVLREGGGLAISFEPITGSDAFFRTRVSIVDTLFESNTAIIGGGFSILNSLSDTSIDVVDSYFDSNDAIRAGGAAAIWAESFITFSGNNGVNNGISSGICSDYFMPFAGVNECRAVWQDFMFPDNEFTPQPSSAPYSPPTRFPVPAPTRPPTPDFAPQSCISTSGECASSFFAMQDELFAASMSPRGYSIAVCGAIFVPEPLILEGANNLTICCNDTQRCSFDSGGMGQNLVVDQARNVTLRGLAFHNGNSGFLGGGNVAMRGPGPFVISHCLFSNGTSPNDFGGNLLVGQASRLDIFNSIFEFGIARDGGGAVILDVPTMTIQGTYFAHNVATDVFGGGLFAAITDRLPPFVEPSIIIVDTLFESNFAVIGGGFMVDGYIPSSTLYVIDSVFDSNEAWRLGGAGAVSEELIASFSGNDGGNNGQSSGACPDFGFEFGDLACFAVWEEFTLPGFVPTPLPTDAPYPYPSHTPTRSPTPVPAPVTCISSFGRCASSYVEMVEYVDAARIGYTISVCGSIFVPEPLIIQTSNLTICCNDTQRCSFNSGGGANMIAEGVESLSVRGLAFNNGVSEAGGNLLIVGPGHHRISHCLFSNGSADRVGGNLVVGRSSSVLISNSIFESGSAIEGGSVYIVDTPIVTVDASFFTSNFAEQTGGGLHIYIQSVPDLVVDPVVRITNTLFESNFAGVGGGIYLENGYLATRMFVSDSYFAENDALISGGAVAIRGETILVFSRNDGVDNGLSAECPDYFIGFDSIQCRPVFEEFTVPDSLTFGPTHYPTNAPTYTDFPNYVPTPAPSPAFGSCTPTIGVCARDFWDLSEQLVIAQSGDVISVCGSMFVPELLHVVRSGLTLCCDTMERCVFTSGGGQNLIVNGRDTTLIGLAFEGGDGSDAAGGGGGNVVFFAPGHHRIIQCHFFNGTASLGGNLFIDNADSVVIRNSIFEAGVADRGGGAMIVDTPVISVEGSFFTFNFANSEGGALFVEYSGLDDRFLNVTILSSLFELNTAVVGGGFAVATRTSNSNIFVIGSHFAANDALRNGGAGAIQNDVLLYFTDNSGSSNGVSSAVCQDFSFGFLEDPCRDVNEDIMWAVSPYDPTPAPTHSMYYSPAPTIPFDGSCSPTFDMCAGDYEQLFEHLLEVPPFGTVSLCGSFEIGVPAPEISASNVTICCHGSRSCTLSGQGQKLIVKGPNVSIRGISFIGGGEAVEANGGQLMIDAPGDHFISQSNFYEGISERYGGNVYVANANSVTIHECAFLSGVGVMGGGGLAVDNTPSVFIEESFFGRNLGEGGGGGALVMYSTLSGGIPQSTSIVRSVFDSNQDTFGGGAFMTSGLGSLPTLVVLESTFFFNWAPLGGIGLATDQSLAIIDANSGAGNQAESCPDFLLADTCVGVNQTYFG